MSDLDDSDHAGPSHEAEEGGHSPRSSSGSSRNDGNGRSAKNTLVLAVFAQFIVLFFMLTYCATPCIQYSHPGMPAREILIRSITYSTDILS